MALFCSSPSMLLLTKRSSLPPLLPSPPNKKATGSRTSGMAVRACINPFEDQPILRDAIKEPVVFMGGVFAGLLRLDLNEDPLKEWIAKTVEASGMSPEELADAEGPGMGGEQEDAVPQQIEIE